MRKVLLFGGGRMIGPPLIEILLEQNCQVTVVNRKTPPRLGKINYISGDRLDRDFVEHLKQISFDYILDLSCYEPDAVKISIEAFSNKVEKYFLMSTGLVYKSNGIYPFRENHERGDNFLGGEYAIKKLKNEKIIEEYADKLNIILLRAPYIVGQPDFMNRLQFICHRLLSNHPIFIPGYGNAPYQLSNAVDVARAIYHLVFNVETKIGFNPFNIGSSECISSRGLIDLLAGYLKIDEVKIRNIFLEEINLSNDLFSWEDLVFPFPDQTFILDDNKLLDTGFTYSNSLSQFVLNFVNSFLPNYKSKNFSIYQAEYRANKIIQKRKEENDQRLSSF
jgi:nucleoside-diphosphate-sugar epimerase